MSIKELREAVEAGEYHRIEGPAKYLQFLHDCADAGWKASPATVVDALYRGKDHCAAILRALEEEGRDG